MSFFTRFGRSMTLDDGENDEISFKGFLQPLRYKNKMYLAGKITEIGFDTLRKFVLICPAEVPIPGVVESGVVVKYKTSSFSVDHAEVVYLGDRPLYRWAIVHQNNTWEDEEIC